MADKNEIPRSDNENDSNSNSNSSDSNTEQRGTKRKRGEERKVKFDAEEGKRQGLEIVNAVNDLSGAFRKFMDAMDNYTSDGEEENDMLWDVLIPVIYGKELRAVISYVKTLEANNGLMRNLVADDRKFRLFVSKGRRDRMGMISDIALNEAAKQILLSMLERPMRNRRTDDDDGDNNGDGAPKEDDVPCKNPTKVPRRE